MKDAAADVIYQLALTEPDRRRLADQARFRQRPQADRHRLSPSCEGARVSLAGKTARR